MKGSGLNAPLWLASLVALLPAPARADGNDMACKLRGHVLNESPWLYNLPKAAELPPMSELEGPGGLAVLDESVHNRGTCQYSFIGMAGGKNALAAMGSVLFSTVYIQRPEVQRPGAPPRRDAHHPDRQGPRLHGGAQ